MFSKVMTHDYLSFLFTPRGLGVVDVALVKNSPGFVDVCEMCSRF